MLSYGVFGLFSTYIEYLIKYYSVYKNQDISYLIEFLTTYLSYS